MNDSLLNNSLFSSNSAIFLEMLNIPIYCNLLWSEQDAAKNCPKGDLKLTYDSKTGLISNVAYDPSKLDYDQDYENSLHYSPRFQQYAQSLAQELVERHQLYQKNIIEIGCGKGDFLISLAQLGDNHCIGFDPTYVPRAEHQSFSSQVQFIQDFYSERYQNYQADLICCRHTLEHVIDPAQILQPLRKAIGNRTDTIVFFEVPNALYTFRHLAIWDLIYEHCCYYAPTAFVNAFINHGFDVKDVREVFDGQFICLEAVPTTEAIGSNYAEVEPLTALEADLNDFTDKFAQKISFWTKKLQELTAKKQKVVAWGAGSKGVTFLNLLQDHNRIDYIVDLNPRKQGKFVAGSGQKIIAPEFLREYQPDIILVMNSIYEAEIRQLVSNLGVEPEYLCV
ncbi:Methyltransferase type 12 [Stanieria cyanosphaera PCC 7437]|uniref:Methyltransferase type 12 n=1 Tax=Stanieria cyanosphaera (strain ATCC 29371 / PCC 7437) TaxID=111780 RepID=K9XS76_STAC7|nr:class I SAM-dependent methyltransferase [Stanieria cyanosphaera]AFZ34911.1 Methyltransferase type 12 [Stanieria cyanosphaera PCC 7437]